MPISPRCADYNSADRRLIPANAPPTSAQTFAGDPDFSAPPIHPFLAFLARASALHMLIESGDLSIEDAFARLMPVIVEIAECLCHREVIEHFDEIARELVDRGDRHGDQHHDVATCHSQAADNGWLRGLVRAVANATEADRNSILNWATCRGGKAVRDGKADEDFVADVLVEAAMRAGLSELEAVATVRSGLHRT